MEINKRMSVDYNNRGNKERRYLNNGFQSNQKSFDTQYSDDVKKNDSTINKSSTDVRERKSSVVFEHIVPNAVKKMWVMAETGGSHYNINQQHNNHQEKLRNSSVEDGQNLSSKYGNIFLSRDAAKENNESNEEQVLKMRNDSVSESTELPQAKSQWGIELKPVSSENGTHSFPKLRKVSSGKKTRPRSTVMDSDSLPESQPLSSKHQSQSLDLLDQADSKSEDYPSKLTVQQRMKNFENSLKSGGKEEQSAERYAYLHTKRPLKPVLGDVDLRGKSKLFYQPQSNQQTFSSNAPRRMSDSTKSEKRNSRAGISLKDLLQQDEESLSVGVDGKLELNDKNNNITVGGEVPKPVSKKDYTPKETTDTNKISTSQFQSEKASSKKDNIIFNGTTNPSVQNSLITAKDSFLVNNKSKAKEVSTSKTINKPTIQETKSQTPAIKPANTSLLNGTAKVVANNSDVKESFENTQDNKDGKKLQKTSSKTKSEPKDTVKLQHNKLGQAILSQEATTVTNPSNKSSHFKESKKEIKNDENSTLYIISNDENKAKTPLISDNEMKKNTMNLLNKELHDKKKVENTSVEKPKISNLTSPKKATDLPAQNVVPKPGSGHRVGKLIIMSGEQRDKQLKENAPNTGIVLTFLSNEVSDDDPNEPPPQIPEIIFNGPVQKVKSIVTKPDKNRKKKRGNVHFKSENIIHTYPSESSYLDETDAGGEFSKTENAVHRERERLSSENLKSNVETIENVNFVTEGEDFNSYSSQESGSALLF